MSTTCKTKNKKGWEKWKGLKLFVVVYRLKSFEVNGKGWEKNKENKGLKISFQII